MIDSKWMLQLLLFPVLIANFVTSVRKGEWPIRPPARLGKPLTLLKGNLHAGLLHVFSILIYKA
jgi:hypothetical protein